MRAGERLAMAVVLSLVAVAGSAAGAATYAWRAAGTIRLAVHEAGPDGTDVSIRVPAILLDAAIVVCPTPRIADDPEALAAVAAMGAVADELARMPDAVLVDVRDGEARITVEKSDGRLLIRVREPDEWVDLDVPIGSVRRLAAKLGRAA